MSSDRCQHICCHPVSVCRNVWVWLLISGNHLLRFATTRPICLTIGIVNVGRTTWYTHFEIHETRVGQSIQQWLNYLQCNAISKLIARDNIRPYNDIGCWPPSNEYDECFCMFCNTFMWNCVTNYININYMRSFHTLSHLHTFIISKQRNSTKLCYNNMLDYWGEHNVLYPMLLYQLLYVQLLQFLSTNLQNRNTII